MLDVAMMTPMQQAVVALQAQRARIAALERAASEPIAIVGMACRYPADAVSPAAMWDAVRNGRDGSREVPPDRWNIADFYDPTPGRPGKMYVRNGCFISGVDAFEPLFFRISPREAVGIDPQQRLLLEVTWEALEDAGLSPPSLVGSQTGVFVGISTNDYSALLSRTAHGSGSNATAGAGNAASVASGRLSYTFGFQGPCFALDTACSSSLVATHVAAQSLRNKECDLAVVAGVNLMLTPDITVNFCQGRMLSPDGHCKTFDAAADGYARGEGCGVVLLRRLSDAIAGGDRVLAVIRGSAVNQDGRSAGLTAPNGLAQEAVIRKALSNAGLPPDAVDYIEAHGTGTALGDPIEMHALKAVFAGRTRPLNVGSVKTNIGHTEAAAGVAGLIKAALMLQHQEVPPTLHFRQLNPHIELDGVDIRVPTSCEATPLSVVGVSSFGFSGTNAHVVLGTAPAAPPVEPQAGPTRLLISAHSKAALLDLVRTYKAHLAKTTDSFADICHTAATGRARLPWWVCVVDAKDLASAEPSNAPLPPLVPPGGRKVALPTMAFQRQRCWIDAPAEAEPVIEADLGQHPLLGRKLSLPLSAEARWDAAIASSHPALSFLSEHQVRGQAVLPAAGFVEMALAAHPGCAIVNLDIPAPFPVTAAPDRRVQTIADADGSFRIISYRADADAADPVVHATGRAVPRNPPTVIDAPARRPETPVDPTAIYTAISQRGVSHGSAFRLLDRVYREEGTAIAALRPTDGEARFGIHPARLDAAFQLVAAALPEVTEALLVPARIGRVALHHPPAAEAAVRVTVERDGDGVVADLSISDAAGIALQVHGLAFRPAEAMPGHGQAFYRLDWQPRKLVAGLAPPAFLPSPEHLAGLLRPTSARLADEHGMAAYERTARGLEGIATAYVVHALRRLGLDLRPGTAFTFGATAEALGIAERHHRLLRHLLQMLVADGILSRSQRSWRVLLPLPDGDPEAAAAALLAAAPGMAGEIGVLRRCGGALAEVLAGTVDPLSLLFPADSAGAGAFYETSAYARTVNGILAAAAGRMAAAQPLGRVLRILEIGAGTGGATGAMLRGVPAPQRHYVFTDVSQSFLAGASRKFAGEDLVTGLFDLERAPQEQGFAPASFDVVLAANVLHATRDLRQSLAHIHGLLAPGGVLLLVESTVARRWIDIVFGLTEGWWRFADADIRPDHPLLTLDRWRTLLGQCGFETADDGGSEIILARRRPEPAAASRERWFLDGDVPALPALLAAAGQGTAPAAEARRWVVALPPAAAEEHAQVALMERLVAVTRRALREAQSPSMVFLADATLGHAGVSGFVRTLALEEPRLRPRLLIAPPSTEALLDELLADDAEAEIRWDAAGCRQAPRLINAPVAEEPPARVGGAWLITGGRGGVALAIAGWLAAHGAREVILLSRGSMDETPALEIPVRTYSGDAADAALLGRILREHAVEGVVHAAGLLDDAPIVEQTGATIGRVAHAKIGGALALDRAAREHAVRHFVLCASVAGVLGSARQGNHAFCSSFLDGLAEQRRAAGLPALSLDWGVWRKVGSAAALGFDARAEQLGLGSIEPREGTALFGRSLGAADAQLLVLPSVDWQRFTVHFGQGLPALFRDVATPRAAPDAPPHPSPARLNQHAELERIVRACLGLAGAVDHQTPLHDLGLDSLVAVEIRNRVEQELGVAVSIRELIEGASIATLGAHLAPAASQDSGRRDGVIAVISAVLGLGGTVDDQTPLHDLGLDSLMAVEIKNRLAAEAGIEVSVRELIEGATIRMLLETRHGPTKTTPIEAAARRRLLPDLVNRFEPFPLTDMQQAYWLGRRNDMTLGSVSCYLYTEFDTAAVDLPRAEAAWNALVRRHDMLRVVIRADGTQQILRDVPEYRFETLDLRGKPAEAELDRLRQSLPQRMAEPGAWPLFDIRITLFGDRARLHMGFDLIALDAASIHALRREWGRLYDDLSAPLPPIGISFRDVVLEQAKLRETAAWRESEAYWKRRALRLPGGPDLPLIGDPARQARRRFQRRRTVVDAAAAMALRREAQRRGLTLATLLAAAYADVLAAWSRTDQFCVTVTSFNRPDLHDDMAVVLGDYTSTILLEVDARAAGFEQRAATLARQLAADLDHAAVGGVHVLREIARQTAGPAAYVPVVFTSALGFARPAPADTIVAESDAGGWDRLGTTVYNVSSTPQVLIDHQISEEDGALLCNWDVVEDMFPPGVVEQVVAGYHDLLIGLAAGEGWDRPLAASLPPLRRSPLAAVPAPEMLHAGFERQVLETPRRTALIGPDLTLDYGTLAAVATHLAHRLIPKLQDGGRDRLVAISFPKGWRQVATVLAVLKAGAAYLPVDPALPVHRRRQLIEQSEALVLDDPAELDAALAQARGGATLPPLPALDDPARLAYVIYTSGSTGTPKGVMIEHAAAIGTVREVNRRWGIGPDDRTLGLSSLSFDLSVYDIFGPLSVGGALVLPDADASRDPSHWADLLVRHEVTVWNSVPALMALQAEYGLPPGHRLRLVLLSGDWVPIDLVGRLRRQAPDARLVALGGATEAAIWSNAHEIGELDPAWASIPYGLPLAGQALDVVNRRGEGCPDWVVGEIEIGGQGVARGYWRDPKQTAERFRHDPLTGERRYRTGDLGRFRPYAGMPEDGPTPIEFLGRDDFQVKVQGYRIELGEIEAALASHPGVAQAVATIVAAADGRDKTLHAFVTLKREHGAEAAAAPAWQDLVAAATAAAQQEPPIAREMFELTADIFTDQAAAAAASAISRLTGSESIPTADTLISRHGVAPRYRFWLERMLPEVARVGMAGAPVSSHAISGVDRFGFSPAALEFLDRVIARLPEILTEREHSSAIYLSEETPDIYARLFAAPNAVIAAALRPAIGDRPAAILEVGGGLGTTLAAIEGALPTDRVSYLFTDVNAHLLRAAMAKFPDRPWLSFATLDLDVAAPRHAGRYDIVIASSALHVAADIGEALRHLRSYLAPGGVLIALEQTKFFPWFDLSMGLQAGFDSRRDLALRPSHPLLSRAEWLKQLQLAGFGPVSVPAAEGTIAERLGFDVILARAGVPLHPTDTAIGERLREHVRERLPTYMVPAAIAAIDRIPLSANGKVDRRALTPATVAAAPSPMDGRLEREVGAEVAKLLKLDHVDPRRSLFELGATSLTLVALQRQLSERFGRVAPLQRIFERPTIAALAAELADRRAAISPLISFNAPSSEADDDRPTMVMMPGVFSLPFYLRDLAAATSHELALVSVQLPGLADNETAIDTVEGQAEHVVQQMRLAGLRPPYLIGGHSFGGLVAIEVARRLRDAGGAVPLLMLGDTVRTTSAFSDIQTDDMAYVAMTRGLYALYGRNTRVAYEALDALPPFEKYRQTAQRMQDEGLFGTLDLPLDRMVDTFKANFRAIGRFRPAPIPGDMAVIRTAGGFPAELLDYETDAALRDPGLGWSDLLQGRLEVRTMPGDHLAMLDPANLPAMADIMIALARDALAGVLRQSWGCDMGAGVTLRELNREITRRRPAP